MNSLVIWDSMFLAVLASLIDVSAIPGRLE
jgi:hypothetical protein